MFICGQMQGEEIPCSGKAGAGSWIGREIADGGLKIRRGIDQAGYSLRSIDKR